MKFGKELLRAAAASGHVIAADDWIDYKRLKKMLKKMMLAAGKEMSADSDDEDEVTTSASQALPAPSSSPPLPAKLPTPTCNPATMMEVNKLVQSQGEREFFKEIAQELDKVSRCFSRLLVDAMAQEERCLAGYHGESWKRLTDEQIRLFTETHMLLLLIENFAVLNYCGFTKILKKHDKLTSTSTKELFMSRRVNAAQFANLRTLRDALQRLEKTFQASRKLASPFRDSASAEERDLEQRHDEISQINKHSHDRLKSLADAAALANDLLPSSPKLPENGIILDDAVRKRARTDEVSTTTTTTTMTSSSSC